MVLTFLDRAAFQHNYGSSFERRYKEDGTSWVLSGDRFKFGNSTLNISTISLQGHNHTNDTKFKNQPHSAKE